MQYLVLIISIGAMYALMSVGYAMVYGVMKLSNFSHGVVMVSCGYLSYFMVKGGINWILSVLAAALFGALLSTFIEFVAFRRIRNRSSATVYMFVSSITVLLMFKSLFSIWFGNDERMFPDVFGGNPYIHFGNTQISKISLIIIAICTVLLLWLTWFLKKTKMGITIRAAAADQNVCRLMGVRTDLIVSLVFALAGAMGGCCGVFIGMMQTVSPTTADIINRAFIATIIGGMGSMPGAVIGAFMMAALEVLVQLWAGWAWVNIGAFVLAIGFLLVRPQGILGEKIDTKV